MPAVEGQHGVVHGNRAALFLGFLAIAVEGLVQVSDLLGLQHGFHEEGVVGPAGAGDGLEADVVGIQEVLAIERRPDGGVVLDQMDALLDAEEPVSGNASAVAAVDDGLLRGVRIDDPEVGGLHDIGLFVETARICEHCRIHARADPVVGFDDGNPVPARLCDAAVAGRPVAFVGLVDHADLAVRVRVGLHDGKRVVGAAVVQADHFHARLVLAQDGVQALLQVGRGVEDRDDYADAVFHDPSSGAGSSVCMMIPCAGWLPDASHPFGWMLLI